MLKYKNIPEQVIINKMSQHYTIQIVADAPPKICLGDTLAGGHVISIACANDAPDIVSAAWLAQHLTLSKSTVVKRCVDINIGTHGKHLYNREQAIALLTTKLAKRGRPRAN